MTASAMMDRIVLAKGAHDDCDDPQRCLFEWYNWLLSQTHTDACPPDVSPVLHAFGRRLNDALDNDRRQLLKRFLPLPGRPSPLAGTRRDRLDKQRGYLALDWLIRTFTPAWLDLADLTAEATAVRDFPRIVDLATAQAAGPVVRQAVNAARASARAAGCDTWDAASSAAWAAVAASPWDAATWAVRTATRAAGSVAAAAAASDAAWVTAREVGAAASAAAWVAVEANSWKTAASDVLQPTVDSLRLSAIDLYERMIRPSAG